MSELALPEGWIKAELNALAEFINGKAFKSSDWEDKGLPIIRIQNLNNQKAPFNYISSEVEDKYKVFNGDLLFAWSASIDCYIWNRGDALLNQHIFNVKPFQGIDLKFFFYALKKLIYQIHNHTHGTGMVHVTKGKLLKLEIGLPSLHEQKELGKVLDNYLTTVSQIQARLDAIPKLIEKFRQSVVRDAVSGELVNYKSELNKVETISLEEVVVSSMNGLSKRSGDSGEAEVVLRLADFKDSKRVYGGERKIRLTPKELEKYRINNEDILIVRVNGSVDLAGKFILYKEEDHPEAFCDHFIKLTLDSDRVRPEFVVLIANEGEGRYYLKNSLSTSAGQNTINQKSVKGLELKLPPLEIQDKIIKKVNFLFAYADQIEKSVAIAKARVDNLTQSILHQAFTGQLTKEWREQNPELISGDNSAEALLAKIEAEKKASGKKGKAKK